MHCTLVQRCRATERVHCTAYTVWVSKLWSIASLKTKQRSHSTETQNICTSAHMTLRLSPLTQMSWILWFLFFFLPGWFYFWLFGLMNGCYGETKQSWCKGGNFAWLFARQGVSCTGDILLDTKGRSVSSDVSGANLCVWEIISSPDWRSFACQTRTLTNVHGKQGFCFPTQRGQNCYTPACWE